MASLKNPFKPSFGVSPPLLVGRGELLKEFSDALEDGPGAPGRATLYTGSRGTGKTVVLNAVEAIARERGWMVISETANAGFVSRIREEHLPAVIRKLEPPPRKRTLTGATAPMAMGSLTWKTEETKAPSGLRTMMTRACELLEENGAGLLFTLDEVHAGDREELREFATTFQHLVRDEREIAFAGAGLPTAVKSVLQDEVLTFLRRASRHVLGPVAIPEVAEALSRPIEEAGRKIDPEALQAAAEATGGYPFMIQLVGYHAWRQSPTEQTISMGDVNAALVAARRRLGSLVHEPALSDLSETDRTYLLAMAQDDGPSPTGAVAERMGVTRDYAGQYRRRLIEARVIVPAGYGHVDFELPGLREYLREHAALEVQRQ